MPKLRLCIIGNSHIAALKLAWEEMAREHADIELTFFGSRGQGLSQLEARGRKLVPATDRLREEFRWTSGGNETIAIDEYDVLVIYGLYGLQPLVKYASNAHCLTPESDGLDVAIANSKSLDFDRFIDEGTLAGRILRMTRAFDKNILLCPQPRASEDILSGKNNGGMIYGRKLLDNSGQPIEPVKLLLEKLHAFEAKPHVLAQPASTLASVLVTRREFSTDSIKLTPSLDSTHEANDYGHMNKAFGMLALEQIIARCRAMPVMPRNERHIADNTTAVQDAAGKKAERRHPYIGLPEEAYWKRSVADRDGEAITGWYKKKFDITDSRIATAGSCFAQHIGRRLRHSGFSFVDVEPAPADIPAERQLEHGYGMYSGRYGNVYTTRQLLQLFERAFGEFQPKEHAWKTQGGYVDPFRPTIQPSPFASIEELVESRTRHLAAVREMFETTDVFVFTLGLTEAWQSSIDGAVFPIAPGVSGGDYDPAIHSMHNLSCQDVVQDLRTFMSKARAIKKNMRFLLTVSPVPLMATAGGEHVVAATTYSKSVLRAAAGQLAQKRDHIDYFPSFEIINSHVMGGRFYEEDKRSVMERGVDHVMRQFFAEHIPPVSAGQQEMPDEDENDVLCDEALLAAFGADTAKK